MSLLNFPLRTKGTPFAQTFFGRTVDVSTRAGSSPSVPRTYVALFASSTLLKTKRCQLPKSFGYLSHRIAPQLRVAGIKVFVFAFEMRKFRHPCTLNV
eukprot:TRINITY_DN4504_c0_g1_i1.p2 TRINITY_DN4504_c0_g1~~TRINITY_DN4504_c0_g1_i1.p2  ORF type:complete len:98 (-),score=1.66 TRINITY_DN4504_c0_g1_i1:87-380(-)